MGTWDQGSLGEMRTSTLLDTLGRGIGLPVTWLPLTCCRGVVEVTRERDLDLYGTETPDDAIGSAFQACLQGITYQVRQDMNGMGSLTVDTPDRWDRMYGQGVVGPVRIGLIKDLFNFRVRVGIRVLGIPYMLPPATEVQVLTNISHISQDKDQYDKGDSHATAHPYLPSI